MSSESLSQHSGPAIIWKSPPDKTYNCIAWAAGSNTDWWEPDAYGYYHWPRSAPRNYSLKAWIMVFQSIGYVEVNNESLEDGVEKVAIYARNGAPTHVARQLANGVWTSKLGDEEDVEHRLGALVEEYGLVVRVLKRTRSKGSPPAR